MTLLFQQLIVCSAVYGMKVQPCIFHRSHQTYVDYHCPRSSLHVSQLGGLNCEQTISAVFSYSTGRRLEASRTNLSNASLKGL